MHGTIGPIAAPSDVAGSEVLATFESMPCGGILLDEHGRVLRLNTRAHQYLGDGLTFADQHITAQDTNANRALQALITAALQPKDKRSRQALALPRSGARSLIVRVLRTAGGECSAFESTRAVVLLFDPHERPPSAEALLQAVFCLTPAEARVALGVMGGDTLEEIAQAHHTALNTVRVQMRAVLKKTQTARQAELVTLLMRMVLVPG